MRPPWWPWWPGRTDPGGSFTAGPIRPRIGLASNHKAGAPLAGSSEPRPSALNRELLETERSWTARCDPRRR